MIRTQRANPSHLKPLHRLFDQYRAFYHVKPASALSLKFIQRRLEKEDSIIFIAECNQSFAGFVQIYPAFSSVAMQPLWILNDLFVGSEFRRLGVARKLLKTVHSEASKEGIFSIKLATAVDNEQAKRLYSSMNYKLIDQFEHFSRKID